MRTSSSSIMSDKSAELSTSPHPGSHHLHLALFTWPFICSLNIPRSQACLQATMVGVATTSKLFFARNRETIPPMLLLLNLHMNPILQVLFFF